MGVLRSGLKRDILILLAFLADEASALTYKNQMRQLTCGGWYKRTSFASAISRLLSVGDIEKVEKKGQVYFRLTSIGSSRLKESLPLAKFANKKWDRLWRIVIFDIKEKNRTTRISLRNKLLSLGFGQWQKSVYITPHDVSGEVNQYLKSENIFPNCVCLVAKRSGLGNDRGIAEAVWDLKDLSEEYADLFRQGQKLLGKINNSQADYGKLSQLWADYKDTLIRDPFLPKELLPSYWQGKKAQIIIQKACHKI